MTDRARVGADPWRTRRWALSAVVAFDLVAFLAFIPRAFERAAAANFELPWWVRIVAALPGRTAVVVAGLVATLAFARRRTPIISGALALLALALLSHTHAALNGAPWRHLYYSGIGLLGWLAGLAFARARDLPDAQRYAGVVATALLGAAYFSAGLSKLLFGGIEWLAGETLRHAVVAQDGLIGAGLLHDLRLAVVNTPAIAAALATATVGFELGGLIFLVGPRTRALVGAGLVLMHLSIFVLTGIAYVESIAVLLIFAWPHPPPPDPPAIGSPSPRATVLAALVLGLFAVAAIARQGLDAAVTASPDHVVAAPTRSLGPFALDDEIAGFRVVELAAGDDAATVFLARGADRLGFDLTCRPDGHAGPFDRPPLHVYYRETTLPFADLAPAGEAVRDLALAAGDPDVCAALTRWIGTTR